MPDTTTGTFLGADGDRARVRLETGAEVSLRIVGSYMPTNGDIVRITRDGSTVLVDGLATPREPIGTIEAVGRSGVSGRSVLTATVRTQDNRLLAGIEVLDHITDPAAGDSVVVFAGFIIGRRRAPTTSEES
ncbi:hypothetical protein C5B92_07030 [Rathayibacter sp. AY1A4]|uniref:hypothetical protein n=1 Tax=Rathayibacter sp. AY1A4 TaxID=2080522 RepID=UPI000CE8297E|nr:hypothetical protein [Rathayibacter sp. AY1A4]PPF18262.1 hypothetical protein C5B92_07030 [Rathayibacter sp. AY1A4]